MEQLSIDVRYDLEHMEVTLSISDWQKLLKAFETHNPVIQNWENNSPQILEEFKQKVTLNSTC